jgi:hypothetical protein
MHRRGKLARERPSKLPIATGLPRLSSDGSQKKNILDGADVIKETSCVDSGFARDVGGLPAKCTEPTLRTMLGFVSNQGKGRVVQRVQLRDHQFRGEGKHAMKRRRQCHDGGRQLARARSQSQAGQLSPHSRVLTLRECDCLTSRLLGPWLIYQAQQQGSHCGHAALMSDIGVGRERRKRIDLRARGMPVAASDLQGNLHGLTHRLQRMLSRVIDFIE